MSIYVSLRNKLLKLINKLLIIIYKTFIPNTILKHFKNHHFFSINGPTSMGPMKTNQEIVQSNNHQ